MHDDGVEARLEALPLARRPALDEPEVEERDAAVVVEPVVAGVRIAVEGAEALDRVLPEAPDHLADPLPWSRATPSPRTGPTTCRRSSRWSARGCATARARRPGCAPTGGRRSGGRTPRRCAPRGGSRAPRACGPAARRPGPRASRPLQRQRREHRVHHLGAVEVLLDRLADAGELHLDGDLAALLGLGAVDLPDAGGGHRQVVPAAEDLLGRRAELGLDDRRRRASATSARRRPAARRAPAGPRRAGPRR